jgi:prepilin-type N-terminal cleavage/methylation domain-containing protein
MIARQPIVARRGFTLIEVMISVGIVVLLGTLVLTAVHLSKVHAYVIRTRSDLASIGTALSAYKADFGDYPRFVVPATDLAAAAAATPDPNGGYAWLDNQGDRGARLLCRALIGPAGGNPAGAQPGDDGADGPGFRIRRGVVTEATGPAQLAGKVWGPYLQADRWKLVYDPSPPSGYGAMYNAKMLDVYGNPVLYYPATPGGASRIRQTGGFVANYTVPTGPSGSTIYPLYNAFDNSQDQTAPLVNSPTGGALLAPTQMTYILGDRNGDNTIDNGESAVTTEPYLLWSAGPDGVFGFGATPGVAPKTDDICNFDIPADLRN